MSPEARSALMSRIRGKDTRPELTVRSLLFARGYRYRLHRRDLPGTPDIVFPSRQKVIFVNGCFWHGHSGCKLAVIPSTRSEFWENKIRGTQERDKRALDALEALGWGTFTVWECNIQNLEALEEELMNFLGPPGNGDKQIQE